MTIRIPAIFVAVSTVVSVVVVAAPAHAAPAPVVSVFAGSPTVHTVNGQAWHLGVSSFGGGQNNSQSLLEVLSHNVSAGSSTESHSWSLPPLPASTLTFNQRTGRGVLKTPSSTATLTTLNLVFTASSHRSAHCVTGSETVYSGKMSGRATLHTGLKRGGTVGGAHVAFAAVQLTVDRGCTVGFPNNTACEKAILYNATQNSYLNGLQSGAGGSITVGHNVALSKPAGTSRSDMVVSKPSTPPTFNAQHSVLTIHGSTGGLVTGSGRLAGGSPSTSTRSCKVKSAPHTQTTHQDFSAAFTNTAGHALVGHSSLTGNFTVKNGASGTYTVLTWH